MAFLFYQFIMSLLNRKYESYKSYCPQTFEWWCNIQTNWCFQTKALSRALNASYEYDIIAVTILTYDTQVYMSAPTHWVRFIYDMFS